MTNEAAKIEGPYLTRDFTVASGTIIPQYTLCMFSGDRTAAASTGADVAFAGIAATEKTTVNSDTSTNLGMIQTGVFDLRAGGGTTIAAGALVELSGDNTVEATVDEAAILAGQVVGRAMDAAAIGTAETIEVDIGVRG